MRWNTMNAYSKIIIYVLFVVLNNNVFSDLQAAPHKKIVKKTGKKPNKKARVRTQVVRSYKRRKFTQAKAKSAEVQNTETANVE